MVGARPDMSANCETVKNGQKHMPQNARVQRVMFVGRFTKDVIGTIAQSVTSQAWHLIENSPGFIIKNLVRGEVG